MDLLGRLNPIFSLVAHAVRNRAECGGALFASDRLRADVEGLIARAREARPRVGAARFDQAWYPLCAWLDEVLGIDPAPPGEAAGGYVSRYFHAGDPGGEFFERLNLLLHAVEAGEGADEARPGLAACHAALELGFRGRYRRPGDGARLAIYLRRCRDALAAASAERVQPDREAPVVMIVPAGGALAALPFWLVPVAATAGLFVLYRFLLADLYAVVVG